MANEDKKLDEGMAMSIEAWDKMGELGGQTESSEAPTPKAE